MNTTAKNIGGSILPSSDPSILKPLQCAAGTLQVVPLPQIDTHCLTLDKGLGPIQIAFHPNGYSCHSLAKRIASGDGERIVDQAGYIERCGGIVRRSFLSLLRIAHDDSGGTVDGYRASDSEAEIEVKTAIK